MWRSPAAGAEAGGPRENASVEVHPDGSATILTGTSPHGQGHATVWAMLASEELGIPVDRITVTWGDTDLVPEGGGTGGSRSLQLGGAAVRQASRELVEVARDRAADDARGQPRRPGLRARAQRVRGRGLPATRSVPLAELAARGAAGRPDRVHRPGRDVPVRRPRRRCRGRHRDRQGRSAPDRRPSTTPGTVLNPLIAEGQRHGGIAQGAAQAFLEEVVYDADGNPLTASFADYPFLSATEVPSFELVDMATPTRYNPLGAKGIGEAGTIGATPAVQNAVVDAVAHLGVRHIDMPTSPQRVWRAIQEARTGRKDA